LAKSGAGGLGCDILKCLALSGFRNIDVIDLDTIDPSNLNRQFLFRPADINQPKATTAAAFVNKRVRGAQVTGHLGKIQDKGPEFYKQFNIVICGVDNVGARRWINSYLHSLLEYDNEDDADMEGGEESAPVVNPASVVFLVDSGTEGLRGNIRVVTPGMSSCIDCNVELFPPEIKVPLCTIAATPRSAAHCIMYAALIAWGDLAPYKLPDGSADKYDTDNPEHMRWIMTKAQERAAEFRVTVGGAIDISKTLGVVKNIIPAIASTNALIAAAASNEALKIATACGPLLDNYMLFNAEEGTYSNAQSFAKNPRCEVCGNPPRSLTLDPEQTLKSVLDQILATPQYALQNPRLLIEGTVLYMKAAQQQLRAFYDANLEKAVSELLQAGDVLTVADDALPNSSLSFDVKFR
jgi:ubiquitin-activating enzyme E1 C